MFFSHQNPLKLNFNVDPIEACVVGILSDSLSEKRLGLA
jgi:hypothetical protein